MPGIHTSKSSGSNFPGKRCRQRREPVKFISKKDIVFGDRLPHYDGRGWFRSGNERCAFFFKPQEFKMDASLVPAQCAADFCVGFTAAIF
jgi:hypothetical protein